MPPLLLPFQLVLLMFAGWVNRRQLDVIEYLQEENRVLKVCPANEAHSPPTQPAYANAPLPHSSHASHRKANRLLVVQNVHQQRHPLLAIVGNEDDLNIGKAAIRNQNPLAGSEIGHPRSTVLEALAAIAIPACAGKFT